jgi:multisubunit Na+/H+ antiporter MnhE subunit
MGWRDVRAALIAWGVSMLLWLVFTATTKPSSLLMGAAVATVAAVANAVVRRHLPTAMALPTGVWPDGLRALGRLPVAAVADTGRAFAVLAVAEWRHRWPASGTTRVPVARRPEPEAAVVDLVITLTANSTPNTVVLGRSSDGRHLVVHQLVRRRMTSAADLYQP